MNPEKQTPNDASYDIGLLFPVLFLVGIGIVMVYSASSAVALKKYGSDFLFLKKQAFFALIVEYEALRYCRYGVFVADHDGKLVGFFGIQF